MLTFGAQGAAGLAIRDRGRILLQLRSPWVHHGSTWGLPGGALLPAEDAVAAALRETREETGLRRRDLHLTDRRHVTEPVPNWNYTTVVARLRKRARELGTPPPSAEATRHEWVAIEDVATMNLHPGLAASWNQVRPLLFEPVRVLFVCIGNVCRSPLAEVMLRRMASDVGVAVEVLSAGTWAEVRQGMDPGTAACATEHGLDGSGHTSRQLTADLVATADMVVSLDSFAAPIVERMAAGRGVAPTFLTRPAINPWGMDETAHRLAYEQIAATCDDLLPYLKRVR